MRATRAFAAVLLAAGMAVSLPDAATAQRGQQRMQERIQRTDQQIQRMDRLHDRIRQMDRDMTREMDRIRDRLHADGAQRLMDRDRLHEQDRLRQQERLHEMAGSLGQMAQHMRQAMQQVRAMQGDPNYDADPAMQRETERLHQHLQRMNDDLEEGIRLMEQVHQRLRLRQPAS